MLKTKLSTILFGALFPLMMACDRPSSNPEADTITVNRSIMYDPAFWDYAASSNMLQVEISRLAVEKGTTEKTRALGQRAVDFHGNALERMKKLMADKEKIQLPDSLGGADRGLVQEFQLLEGEEFDTRYRDFIASSHRTQIDRYEEALLRAENQKIRDLLMDMRAHMRDELDRLAVPDSVVLSEE
ncbi:DUF4142 domain-containing protein [Pontibacter diazotrophicus]|uniref:DUF4142 domain-containing protein n=1 Tax=Pontibacter diazotrophicus TaxID=1400979 RepID=A0A3D8LDP1_9BACT|nr:DUF4142 domain-containing protein [Pontibacter diazotrophicus]RDV15561.1 DUF4142 domain-containing protein [Pontibacter diazotrophicus]